MHHSGRFIVSSGPVLAYQSVRLWERQRWGRGVETCLATHNLGNTAIEDHYLADRGDLSTCLISQSLFYHDSVVKELKEGWDGSTLYRLAWGTKTCRVHVPTGQVWLHRTLRIKVH
ncbi:unnamed protein product [Caretta caretta]